MEEAGKLTRAAGVVGLFTLLSRITGLVRDMVLGYLFGVRGSADAFVVAFRIPNLLRRLTAEGALTAGFIPVLIDYLTHHGKAEAQRVVRIVFTFAIFFLAVLTLLGILFAAPLTRLFAPGFSTDPEKFTLTVLLTRLMFPYIFFVSLVALAMGVLNSLRHFMAPALSPVLLNLSIIFCALFLSPSLDEPVTSLAYGVLLGGMAQLLLQFPYLSRHGFAFSFDLYLRHPALRRLLLLMGPAVFGAAVYQVNVLVSTILASMLPGGSVAYLYYADRLLEFPVGIFAIALGTAALPSFSSLVARGEFAELRATLSHTLRLMNFISLPAAVGLMVVAVPVFALFFQRGAFDADATLKTAQALVYYALGLWGIAGTKVVVPAFYAMGDTRTPVWIALWSFVLNIILSLILMGQLPLSSDSSFLSHVIATLSQYLALFSLSHGGLALATSVSATFNFLLLLVVLRYRLGQFPWGDFFLSFLRSLLNSLLMALPLLFIARRIDWIAEKKSILTPVATFLLLLGLGLALYLVLSLLWSSPERQMICQAWHRMKRGNFRISR